MLSSRSPKAATSRAAAALIALASSALVAIGCEPPASANGPATYFTVRTQGHASQLRLDGDRLYGPSTELSRVSPNEYRGRWRDLVVDVRVKDGIVEGTIANQRTELHASSEPDGTLVAQGMVGGMLSNFRLGPAGFTGVIGGCAYNLLKHPDGTYQGRRACGATIGYATVELPRTYDQLTSEQAALYLALSAAN